MPENSEVLPEIGQRARLSKGDILQTMSLYGCPGKLKDKNNAKITILSSKLCCHCCDKWRKRRKAAALSLFVTCLLRDSRLSFNFSALLSQNRKSPISQLFNFSVCGRTYQETKATFGSPQQPSYTTTPGIIAQPYRMVSSVKNETNWRINDVSLV